MITLDSGTVSHCGPTLGANEDFAEADPAAGIFIVADGMGGRPGGSQASGLAAKSFHRFLRSLDPEARCRDDNLRAAVAAANREVRAVGEADPTVAGLGTTLSAVVLHGTGGKVVHVGDSRVYLFRRNGVHQLTRDHTLVAELLARDHISAEGARRYPLRNVLSRCIGVQETVVADIQGLLLQPGDSLLLATDGVTEVLGPDRLREIIAAHRTATADGVCSAIVESALENQADDNLTVVFLRTLEYAGQPRPNDVPLVRTRG